MCQLLAITSRFPISPFPSLSGFFQRAGNTAAHTDGWGVAMYRNNELEIRSHASAAASCSHASNLLARSEEHTSELQSRPHLVCRLLLEKKKKKKSLSIIKQKNEHPQLLNYKQ